MDALTQRFLNILAHSLRSLPAPDLEALTEAEARDLLRLAQEQKVLPLVFEAAHSAPALQQLPQLRQQVRRQVMAQAQKTEAFRSLYTGLRRRGLTPLVVKGAVCRSLYPKPDLRPSGDEDLLLPPDQFPACHEAMLELGMHTTLTPEQLENSYEVPYRSDASPLYIELHRHLFPPESRAYGSLNRLFDGVLRRAEVQTVLGMEVLTLSPTDHLLYLLLHAFKHFLHSGFGIRQVCDIILFANAWGSRVDWDTLLESCRSVRADKFAAALFRIGQAHLVFDPAAACYPKTWQEISVDEGPLLQDLLSGGLYGDASLSRKHSSTITLDAVAAQKQGRAASGLMATLFPPARQLEGRYPYLKEKPWLLPAAWCDRIWKYSRETGTVSDSSAVEALKIGRERLVLLKEYDIVE